MFVEKLFSKICTFGSKIAFFYKSQSYQYDWLRERVNEYREAFADSIRPGDVVLLSSDYTPETAAIFLALMLKQAIIVPAAKLLQSEVSDIAILTQAEHIIYVDELQRVTREKLDKIEGPVNSLYQDLHLKQHAGLVILSSGSSGTPKAIVHDVECLFQKIKPTNKHISVLSFLLFDHIGGLNTLVSALYSGNILVFPIDRKPEEVARSIQEHKVNVLVASPSFLNLCYISKVFDRYDFSSLEKINYGSEVMPEFLLKKLSGLLSGVRFTQAYGMSELGVLPARSENNTSLRFKVDNSKVQYRIVNGMLEIKTNSGMLGYLNAPSPYTEDGWFKTGDLVEQDGEYLQILGRESDVINVGGEKVYPSEVEEALMKMSDVKDAVVYGEEYGVLGKRIVAKVSLSRDIHRLDFYREMKSFCAGHLTAYKIPQKVQVVDEINYGSRYKKMRNASVAG